MPDEIAVKQEKSELIDYSNAFRSSTAFEQSMKMASFLAKSTFVPVGFQNKPSDCLVALQMSGTLDMSVFEVMKGLYVIHGKPAFTSQLAIAIANLRGPFKHGISFRTTGKGPTLEVTAYGVHEKSEREVSASISLAQVIEAGWSAKNKNYKVIPEQMLSYKAALLLIRKTCPEILMGMSTKEEIIDIHETKKNGNKAIEIMNERLES